MSAHPVTRCDCGHDPRPYAGSLGTGYARTPDGRTLCYPCADSAEAADMSAAGRAGDRFTAYVSSDGANITTWSGGVLARITRRTTSRAGFHGSELYYWQARDSDGRTWHGRNGGPGIVLTLRPYTGQA